MLAICKRDLKDSSWILAKVFWFGFDFLGGGGGGGGFFLTLKPV